MTEAAETSVVKAKKKRKPVKRAAAKKPPAETAEIAFPGLTITDCAKACSAAGCVISGKVYCGHPRKGAQCDRSDPEATRRLNEAMKQLANTDAASRFS